MSVAIKRRTKKLTPKQKKAVWAPSKTNAGEGWRSPNETERQHDPHFAETGQWGRK